jgi:GGDEF domain-containing protein
MANSCMCVSLTGRPVGSAYKTALARLQSDFNRSSHRLALPLIDLDKLRRLGKMYRHFRGQA